MAIMFFWAFFFLLQMAGYMFRGPPNGSIYVGNLPPGTDEMMLAEYFGTIGLLKVWVLPGNIFATHVKSLIVL